MKETVKEFLNKAKELFRGFGSRIVGLRELAANVKKACAALAGKAGPLTALLSRGFAALRLTEAKRRPMVFVVGGLSVLLLVLIITAVALGSRRPGEAAALRAVYLIPPEELFIPDEPDFVPDFLLEREPRHLWSIDDIRPYWRTPGNPEFWHNVIRSAVDELMENIP